MMLDLRASDMHGTRQMQEPLVHRSLAPAPAAASQHGHVATVVLGSAGAAGEDCERKETAAATVSSDEHSREGASGDGAAL